MAVPPFHRQLFVDRRDLSQISTGVVFHHHLSDFSYRLSLELLMRDLLAVSV